MTDKRNDNALSTVKSDCEVCKRLIREKHRYEIVWKIACLLFALIAVVFIILYFADGRSETISEVNLNGATVDTSGNENTLIIGGEQIEITGTVKEKNDTPIICITVLAAVVVIVIGGVIIAVSKKNKEGD